MRWKERASEKPTGTSRGLGDGDRLPFASAAAQASREAARASGIGLMASLSSRAWVECVRRADTQISPVAGAWGPLADPVDIEVWACGSRVCLGRTRGNCPALRGQSSRRAGSAREGPWAEGADPGARKQGGGRSRAEPQGARGQVEPT